MWASAGWEQHEVYDDFWGWFRQAIDEMVEWTADEVAFEREQS
jgi:hypothetical protein